MKKIMVLWFMVINILLADCLDKKERDFLSNYKYNDRIPNYIDCEKQDTNLAKFVCANPDYLLLFKYLSNLNIDYMRYESSYSDNKQEIIEEYSNNSSLSDKGMIDMFDENDANPNHICFDLKYWITDRTLSNPQNEERRSIFTLLNEQLICENNIAYSSMYTVRENKYGAALTDREGGKVYLGKNCDVLDDKKQKGFWYKYEENVNGYDKYTYVIKLKDKELKLNMTKIINLDKIECTEYKVKELM